MSFLFTPELVALSVSCLLLPAAETTCVLLPILSYNFGSSPLQHTKGRANDWKYSWQVRDKFRPTDSSSLEGSERLDGWMHRMPHHQDEPNSLYAKRSRLLLLLLGLGELKSYRLFVDRTRSFCLFFFLSFSLVSDRQLPCAYISYNTINNRFSVTYHTSIYYLEEVSDIVVQLFLACCIPISGSPFLLRTNETRMMAYHSSFVCSIGLVCLMYLLYRIHIILVIVCMLLVVIPPVSCNNWYLACTACFTVLLQYCILYD